MSRFGRTEMHTLRSALNSLAVSETARPWWSHLDVMAQFREPVTCYGWNQGFNPDVTSGKGSLREATGLQRFLNVKAVIGDVGNELRVGLRLIPAAQDPEADLDAVFFHERGNDCV